MPAQTPDEGFPPKGTKPTSMPIDPDNIPDDGKNGDEPKSDESDD